MSQEALFQPTSLELEGASRYVPGDRVREVADDAVRIRRDAGAANTVPSTSAEPVLRTSLGTPRQETVAPSKQPGPDLVPVAGAAAGLGVALASASGWLYWRRRQQKRRLAGRLRRSATAFMTDVRQGKRGPLSTSIGAGLLAVAALTRTRRHSRREDRERESTANASSGPEGEFGQTGRAARVTRLRLAALLPLVATTAVLVWFRVRAWNPPRYIGTPGVESAGGRDRTAPGGDLPPDLGRP
jgi:hypothetical protein